VTIARGAIPIKKSTVRSGTGGRGRDRQGRGRDARRQPRDDPRDQARLGGEELGAMRGGRDDDKLMIATGGQTVQHTLSAGLLASGWPVMISSGGRPGAGSLERWRCHDSLAWAEQHRRPAPDQVAQAFSARFAPTLAPISTIREEIHACQRAQHRSAACVSPDICASPRRRRSRRDPRRSKVSTA